MTLHDDFEPAAQRIAERGRQEVVARLRETFIREAATADRLRLEPLELEQLVGASAQRAGAALWRRSLAAAASDVLGVALRDAIDHPAVRRAHEIVGAPAFSPGVADAAPGAADAAPGAADADPPTTVDALRLRAVHVEGLETVRSGEDDIELRFSDAGIDILKASSGARIGRLTGEEISGVELSRPRRGLRRRGHELHVATGRGRASFELPGLTEEQLEEHLEPTLARYRGGGD